MRKFSFPVFKLKKKCLGSQNECFNISFKVIDSRSEIGSVRKMVLIHFNIVETQVCKTVTRLRQERYAKTVTRLCQEFLANPSHRFAYQWLDNIKINKYAKCVPIPHKLQELHV